MTEARELVEAEAQYLEAQADILRNRAKELRELVEGDQEAGLIAKLEGLPFRLAQSKRCDWVARNQVPAQVLTLFDSNGDFKTEKWNFRRMPDGNILRFRRESGKRE